MQQYFKISIGIFFALAASRFIPHPPNYTNLIALSFYIPALLGVRYLPIVLFSFAITDIFFSFHATLLFTWSAVILIGWTSKYIRGGMTNRIAGAVIGAIIFYIVTNFGFWTTGYYGYDLSGLINSYILAIPFFGNSLISTLIYATIFEICYKIYIFKFKNKSIA